MLANYSEIPGSSNIADIFASPSSAPGAGSTFGKSSIQQKLIDQYEKDDSGTSSIFSVDKMVKSFQDKSKDQAEGSDVSGKTESDDPLDDIKKEVESLEDQVDDESEPNDEDGNPYDAEIDPDLEAQGELESSGSEPENEEVAPETEDSEEPADDAGQAAWR